MTSPTSTSAWKALEAAAAARPAISSLFAGDSERAINYAIEHSGIRFDYAKTSIDIDTKNSLLELAQQCGVASKMKAMRAGEAINRSEDRAVLHIALRDQQGGSAKFYGESIYAQVSRELAKLRVLSESIRNGEWRGHTGKRIRHFVNIGIGGSDLGPKMVCEALRAWQSTELTVHFVSNVDDTHFEDVIKDLDPEETVFSVSSKTFGTQETMCNAHLARAWLMNHFGDELAIEKHCVAVTTNIEAATEFGICEDNLLAFWDWVGGRFSLWSAIGLPIAVALGFEQFASLLAGAHSMDQHFFEAEFENNMPMMLALTGIWHNNFCGYHSLGVIPYNDALGLLPMFLQQLDMESNGKSIDVEGGTVDYATGPVVWGQNGSNGQHAFFQLLHQGTSIVPLEFIVALNPASNHPIQHKVLLANMLAQASAFMSGQQAEESKPHTHYAGDRPSVCLALEALTPHSLGALIALYEHKIFVQGAVWNINSFDQWGVQLGKRLANECGTDFSQPPQSFDASTKALMAWIDQRLT